MSNVRVPFGARGVLAVLASAVTKPRPTRSKRSTPRQGGFDKKTRVAVVVIGRRRDGWAEGDFLDPTGDCDEGDQYGRNTGATDESSDGNFESQRRICVCQMERPMQPRASSSRSIRRPRRIVAKIEFAAKKAKGGVPFRSRPRED